MKKLTHEEFLERLERRNPHFKDLEFLSKYITSNDPIKVRCKKCGHIWNPIAYSLYSQGYGCPKCSKILSHEEFLERLKENNPHYDDFEILSKYITSNDPIKVRCKKCGSIWNPRPNALIQGYGCKKCAVENRKSSHEEFLEKVKKNNPHYEDLEFLSEYITSKDPIKVRCKKCGNIWNTVANSLSQGSGCKKCSGRSSHEEFLEKVKKNNPHYEDLEFLSEYITSKDPIKVRCKKCGNIWNARPTKLSSQGCGCSECIKKVNGEKRRSSHEKFLEKVKKNNPHYDDFEILSEYITSKDPIKIRCKKCGSISNPRAHSLIHQNQGCRKCNTRTSHEEFLEKVKKNNPHYDDLEFLSEYTINRELIKVRCKKCGHIWNARPMELSSRGSGCQKCEEKSTSFMEQFLYNSLCDVFDKENVIHRDKSIIGKELDIYIPDKKFAIEIGSWYWHKNRFKKDLKKYKLCQEKNIQLIIIYDTYKDFPKNINNDYIWTYENNLALEKDYTSLKNIVYKCLNLMNINISNSFNWNDIVYKSHNKFNNRIPKIIEWRKNNPNGSKSRCAKETRINYWTVHSYWDYVET